MNHPKKIQPLIINLVQQFKSKGYTFSQVKEKDTTLTIFKHGRRTGPNN